MIFQVFFYCFLVSNNNNYTLKTIKLNYFKVSGHKQFILAIFNYKKYVES